GPAVIESMIQTSPMGQPAGNTLRICSWNCKGLNHPIKRSKVLHHLRHLGAQIAFLQETHLKVSDQSRLRRGWVGQLYHSTFHSKARGAAILIHKSVPFVSSTTILDPNGRYAIVTGHIHSTKLILTNIYAPNWDDANFFCNLFSRIPDMSSHLLVLGGDFNCWLGSLDRSSAKPTTPSKSSKIIRNFLQEFSVTDSWRFFNPTGREYSYFSRIDYLFLEKRLIPLVRSCSCNSIIISDHAPLTLDLAVGGELNSQAP
uniref:exodeoxyribonuclease III n=1 Tax=Sander lucioperca TaxID=283035 RepID=A0A8C9ZN56_SANLU